MASNRGVVYVGPGKVEVRPIEFPKLSLGSRKCEHGVILKVVSTNICGSDQRHMVRVPHLDGSSLPAWCWDTRSPAKSLRKAET